MVLIWKDLPVDLQSKPDFLLLAGRQTPHFRAVSPANQDVARNAFKGSVRFEVSASAVFIDLGRVSFAELRIESLGVTTDFLPRLLKQMGPLDFVIPQVPSAATRMYS